MMGYKWARNMSTKLKNIKSRNLYLIQGNGANQEYHLEMTPVGGSWDEDEGRKGTQDSTERINRKETPFGRPRGRWSDAADRGAKRMLKCRNCRSTAEDRGAWRRRIEEAKGQVRL
jgi:hypothetical protein